MSEEIVIGRMLDPMRIRTEQTTIEVDDWAKRAMWSFLRLQYGRSIDKEIKKRRDQWILDTYGIPTIKADKSILKKAMAKVFGDILTEMPVQDPRDIQFILDEEGKVMAVASLKHLLVSPEKVYGMADVIIREKYSRLQAFEMSELSGATYQVKEVAGFKVGLQVFGGDILTRNAITLSSWLRVEMCLNPLSWLGIGSFSGSFGVGKDFERVLRIKVLQDLKPRLAQGIELALRRSEDIEDRVKASQKVAVKRSDAEIIMSALGLSYSLGAKTIEQLLERLEKEPETQWGMSMASSWMAAHGKFKKTPEGQDRRVEQKLSTIAGAALLLDDLKDAKAKSTEWLKSHVEQGKIKRVDELLREMKKR